MTPKLTTAQRAARLPAPIPGLVVNVPLELLPAYYQLHGLQAMALGEIRKLEDRTRQIHKSLGPVWVRRIDGKENNENGSH